MSPTQKRYVFFWTYALIAIVPLLVVIAESYRLFVYNTNIFFKVTGWGMIILIILALLGRKWFKKWFGNMGVSKIKSVMEAVMLVLPYITLVILIFMAEVHIDKIKTIGLVAMVAHLIAAPLYGVHAYWRDYCIKRDKGAL